MSGKPWRVGRNKAHRAASIGLFCHTEVPNLLKPRHLWNSDTMFWAQQQNGFHKMIAIGITARRKMATVDLPSLIHYDRRTLCCAGSYCQSYIFNNEISSGQSDALLKSRKIKSRGCWNMLSSCCAPEVFCICCHFSWLGLNEHKLWKWYFLLFIYSSCLIFHMDTFL